MESIMERIFRRQRELMDRISENGVLILTLSDINPMIDFEDAVLSDLSTIGGVQSIYAASKVILKNEDGTKIKVLKDLSRPVPYYENLVWKPINNYEAVKL